MQAPQAEGLGMLNPIQPVSSWTADTGVEENKDTFWSSPATGNLNQNVLCLHAPVCCAQLLPLLCFAIPSGVQTAEGNGCAAAWHCVAQGTRIIFLCLSLAQCCEAPQDLM